MSPGDSVWFVPGNYITPTNASQVHVAPMSTTSRTLEESKGADTRSDLLARAKYVLPSHSEEQQRMARQHQLMKDVWPDPFPADFVAQPTDRILESGAATGLWAVEAAERLPRTVSIMAIDIHDKWFPSDKPENVTFEVSSITDLPEGWTSSFDLVHQRFLSFALGLSDWKRAVSEMYRVLRPGGWLILEEFEIRIAGVPEDYAKELPNAYMAERYAELLCEQRQLLANSPDVLADLVSQTGFSDLQITRTAYLLGPGDALKDHVDNLTGVWIGLKTALAKTGMDEAELDKITVGFHKELGEHAIGLPWYRYVARKL